MSDNNNNAEIRARHDLAFKYATEAMSKLHQAFNTENKVANMLLSHAFLESAINALGKNLCHKDFEEHPSTAGIITSLTLQRQMDTDHLSTFCHQTEIPPKSPEIISEEDNVITVNFKP